MVRFISTNKARNFNQDQQPDDVTKIFYSPGKLPKRQIRDGGPAGDCGPAGGAAAAAAAGRAVAAGGHPVQAAPAVHQPRGAVALRHQWHLHLTVQQE